MYFRNLFIFLIVISILSCKKAPDRTCLKKSGNSILKKVHFEEINNISVYDDVNVVFIQDSINFIEIQSYENIIGHISTNLDNHKLEIRNNNKCQFLRDYDKQTTIKIHSTHIIKIELYGKGKIESQNTIVSSNLHIYSHTSNSNINMDISSSILTIEFVNGTLDGVIRGFGQDAYIFHSGYSKVNFIDLETKNLTVINKSYSDTYVNVTNTITAKIENTGNIYYKGSPILLNNSTISSGKLIKYSE